MSSYEVCELENLANNPFCSHGPTILFEEKLRQKRFYACSACRNAKECPFHQEEREFKPSELKKWRKMYKQTLPIYKVAKENLKRLKAKKVNKRIYCHTCSQFVLKKTQKSKCLKEEHKLITGLKNSQLASPANLILKPLEQNKSNAVISFLKKNIHKKQS